MDQIMTTDGSITYHNEEAGECYHSKSGAIEESIEKYAKPADIEDGDRVLDVCFGIGYNALAAIYRHKNIEVIGLEKDPKIIEKISEVEVPDEYKQDYLLIKEASLKGHHEDAEKKIRLKIIMGDARETVKGLAEESFDAVLFDPFSPKKAPHMWTAEFFSDIYKVMKKGAKLTTYSCARIMRDNLKAAGFSVKDGPCVGRRSPSTIAEK